jgi:asparagine synthase (glutamine-hydrolysing)
VNGIVGAWSPGGAPVEKALLQRMALALSAPPGAAVSVWTGGAFGLGGRHWDPPPDDASIPAASGELVALDGRLDDREQLARLLGIGPERSDQALVLAGYRRFGDDLVSHLNGDFSLVVMDPHAGRVLLARDPVGLRPLHYTRLPEMVLISSEIKPLLRHPALPARVNPHHLAEFLLGGAPAPDSGLTFLTGVEAVAPGHRVRITREGVRVDRYWDFPEEPIRLPSPEAYSEEFARRFGAAVARRMRGAAPVAVSVSGGVDSSSVFCMAQWLRREHPGLPPVEGLTEAHPGDPRADETRYVEEMERLYGVAVHRLPGGGLGTLASWSRLVRDSEVPALHPFATATEERVRFAGSLGARVLLGGEWADATVFDQTYLVDLARRGAWGAVRRHLRTIPAWFQDADPRPFRDQFARDLLRLSLPAPLVSGLRRLRGGSGDERRIFGNAPALRPFAGGPPEDPGRDRRFPSLNGRSIYGRVRARRAALDLGSMARSAGMAGVRFALPYMDRELLTFVIGVPGEVLAPDGVPKGLLRDAMRGRMPRSIVERRWKADFTHLVESGLRRYFVSVVEFLRGHEMASELGLVDADALRSALRRWEAGSAGFPPEQFWVILKVLGLELWLHAFLAGPDSQ